MMACFRLFISVALAMFGVCVRCVYGIEEYAVAEYAADFVDLPASVTHLSYDSVITPRDRAESCDDVLNMSSTNEVVPQAFYATISGPRSCPLRFGTEGFIRSHGNVRTDGSISSNSGVELSKFGFFGGRGGHSSDTLSTLIDENRTSGGVLIVDFYANWCQPCVAMKTNLQVVENHYKPGKLVIHKVDVDENQELCNDYEISALPTLIFFSRGNIVKRVKGLVDVGSLMQMIDEILDQSS